MIADEELELPPLDIAMADTVAVVCAYVSRNPVPAGDVPTFIKSVYTAFSGLGVPEQPAEPVAPPKPAVPIQKSISEDFIVCLEDGKKFKSLKRHLMAEFNMTPADYRKRWGLANDYPMVAPAYSKARSALAKGLGLGRKAEPRVVQ